MSTHHHIDLIEFPTNSPEELQKVSAFFTTVFEWKYKVWGDVYSDTPDSGLMSAVSVEPARLTKPLAVLYSQDLEATKEKIVKEGGKIIQDIYPFPGGRRFHFTDPVGNELAVWSE